MVDGVPVFTGLTFDGSISSGMLSFQGSLEMQDLPESMPRIIIEGMLNVASIFSISLGNIELGFVEETYYDEYWDEYYSYLEFRELIVRNAGYFAPEYGVEIALNSLAWLVDSADISAEIDTNVVFGEFEFLFAGKLKASYDENLDQIAVTISDVRVEQSGYPTLVSKWIYITIGDEITGHLEFTTDEGILLTLTLEVDEWDSFALEGEFTTEAGDELATVIFDPGEEVLEVHYIDETTDYIVFEPIGMY